MAALNERKAHDPVSETNPRLLLIDDDRELGRMLSDYFASDDMELVACTDGPSGIETLRGGTVNLVILDLMMPQMNGLEVLKRIREESQVPVIMLTARGDDVDRIIGLEFGADDYLAKPFNPRELLARIRAILRRTQDSRPTAEVLRLGSISLDPASRTARVHERAMTLTGTEFEILRCLLRTPGVVVSKETLSETALGRRLLPYDRSIDTHISNLRSKLEQAGSSGETIRNQRGIGYLLIPGPGSRR